MQKNTKILIGLVVVAAVMGGGYFANVGGLKGCIGTGRGCSAAPTRGAPALPDFAIQSVTFVPSSSKGYERMTINFKNSAPIATTADLSVMIDGKDVGPQHPALTTVKDTSVYISADFLTSNLCEGHRIFAPQISITIDKDKNIKESDETNNWTGIVATTNCVTNEPITWAEFAKGEAVERAKFYGDNIATTPLGCFSDIKGSWFEPYVCYLKSKSDIPAYSGSNSGTNWNGTITRAVAMNSLSVDYQYVKYDFLPTAYTGPAAYSDVSISTVGGWLYNLIQAAASVGIPDVKPYVGFKFRPNDLLTNIEAQVMMNNLYKSFL